MTDSIVFVFVLMLFLVIVISDLRSADNRRGQRATTSRWRAAVPLPGRDAGDAAAGLGQPWSLWMALGSADLSTVSPTGTRPRSSTACSRTSTPIFRKTALTRTETDVGRPAASSEHRRVRPDLIPGRIPTRR